MVIDTWKKIEKSQFAAIYLVYGNESFIINETKQRIVSRAISEEEMDFNFSSYDLEETPIEVAIEDAETFPFMGERRVVVLQNPVFLTAEKTKEKVEHNIKRFEQYIQSPAPYTILVITANYEKLDERKKITKSLKKSAEVVEAKKLNEQELKSWVRERAAGNSVQIDEDAVELLLTLAGTNLMMLTQELDKLSLYASDTNRIDVEVVERLTARSLEQNIFTLVDKVVHRKIDEALRIYYDLLKQNEEPLKILAILAGQFRLIYGTKELSRRGYGQQKIATTLKVHPFRVKLAAGQAKHFNDKQLAHIIDMLSQGDYEIKTGKIKKELMIEMFLFKLHDQSFT
ncbi:DNA polymerase III subunit delta [Rossellomorea vietnamensis]|uniref:DNA polymerase III subunit delta n=1 Tax=Rossellomorea vietnamensis TaxID=218284 RepID=A0A0P6VZX1_9BACI|nr:DNA polymerase III subunit delta [Rossellomorea vietnamensis]KPL58631.1 DNA polymerase III subunit delta [Rossellomorea vietnamensis]